MIISIDTEKVFDNIQPLSKRNKSPSQVGREKLFLDWEKNYPWKPTADFILNCEISFKSKSKMKMSLVRALLTVALKVPGSVIRK